MGLIWGSSFFWIKLGLQEVGHITLVFFRVLFAVLGMGTFFLITRRRLPRKFLWVLMVLGFFNVALPYMLVSWSEKYITSGMASVLNSTQPLATMVIAALFIKEEKLTFRRIVGLLLGIAGVLVLMSDRLKSGATNQAAGIIAMILAVLCYASGAVFARLNNTGVNPEDQSLGQSLFGLMIITPAMFIFESPVTVPVRPISYIAFAWLGLLGSFFAGITWYSLINEIGPSRASSVMYMAPAVGVILGAVALQEKVDWHLIAGGALILSAIVTINMAKKTNGNFVPIENEKYEG